MLGDVLLIGEHHHRAARSIAAEVARRRGDDRRFVVAISGESGSGKSELAHVLARTLVSSGVVAKPIAVDNFYRIDPLERAAWRRREGVEGAVGLAEVDWDTLAGCVEDFRAGRPTSIPCIDLVTQRVDRLTTDFAPVRVLVVDGLYAIAMEGADLRVFIDLTYHQTGKAQALRGKERQDDLRRRVLEEEHRVVSSLGPRADLRVSPGFDVISAGDGG